MDTASPRKEIQQIVETSVTFLSSSGLSTPAMLTKPSPPTNLGVILCHGFLSDKNSRTNRRLTELLVPRRIATLRFDWYGMGESQELISKAIKMIMSLP